MDLKSDPCTTHMKRALRCRLIGHSFGPWQPTSHPCRETRICTFDQFAELRTTHEEGGPIRSSPNTVIPGISDSSAMGAVLQDMYDGATESVYQQCPRCEDELLLEVRACKPQDWYFGQ